ncbi:MAG: bifunctional diaminohydroxyphosphoribosylaminopyrimidine deaminase/5-amino-6-(5-phosphoribosylamino)uracil reductase RibD [Rikenellaceae bacterium]
MENTEEKYMKRALYLASLAEGKTKTNPMVGCVIVENNEIIGEGYHRKYGEPHAEVNAISSIKQENIRRLTNATLYVTLEPCSHYGKTPPCTDLIIEHHIPRVVVACKDIYPEVNGKGISILRAAGITVEVGMLEKESKELNRRFFCYNQNSRPYIILKWAQTADGYIDNDRLEGSQPTWLTGTACREIVHKMRATESAIIVGSQTVKMDNPSLTVREWSGENPIRIVIDRKLKLSNNYKIFNKESQTLIVNEIKSDSTHIKVDFSTIIFIADFLKELHKRKVCSLIVEGGTKTLNMFIDSDLYDEAHVFISPLSLRELQGSVGTDGVKAPLFPVGNWHKTEMVGNIILKKIVKYDSI